MAELFGIRADGAFRSDNTSASDTLDLIWSSTFTPTSQADFYNFIGVSGGAHYNSQYANQDIVFDGAAASYTPRTSNDNTGGDNWSSRPAIILDKRNLTAASHTVKSRAWGSGTVSGGGAAGNGIAFWSITTPQWTTGASATSSSTTYTDELTLTFTPGTQQDYLVIASMSNIYMNNQTTEGWCNLVIDSVEYAYNREVGFSCASSYGRPPVSFMKVINLTAASHTVKIQVKANAGTSTITMNNLAIIAIPLAALTYQSNEGTASQTTTSQTYSTAASVSVTASNKWYMIIASAEIDNNVPCAVQLLVDGVPHSVNVVDPAGTNNRIGMSLLTVEKINGSSKTVALQFASPNGSSTARILNPRIIVIDVTSEMKQCDVCFRASSGWNKFFRTESTNEVQCQMATPTIATGEAYSEVGKNVSNQKMNSAARFLGIDVKNAANITESYLINRVSTNKTFSMIVYGMDEDNSAIFSTAADYTGRTRTTASVNWNPASAAWSVSGDIQSVIEEITARAGWVQGNALSLEMDGANATSNNYYRINTLDYHPSVSRPMGMYIKWSETMAAPLTPRSYGFMIA